MITAIFVAAMMQSAAINSQRDNYLACLKTGLQTATTQKMAPDAIEPFLRQTCASVEGSFEASLVAFDLKNKVSRKQATSDAQLQVNDFVTSSVERYKSMNTPR